MTKLRITALGAISALVCAVSFSSLSAQTLASQNSAEFEITDFIGRITVVNGETVKLSGADETTVTQDGQRWAVSGDIIAKASSCRENNSRVEISLGDWSWRGRRGGYKNLNEYPHLKITLPPDAYLKISNSVIYGDVDNIGRADIDLRHCGDLVLGNISRGLDLNISGSADFTAKDIGKANVRVTGSGDVTADNIGALSLDVTGSGSFEAKSVTGSANITVQGSGSVEIDDVVGNLDYEGNGSGELSIDDIEAEELSIRINGSGDVEIDSGEIGKVSIITNGSSDVSYDGKAENLRVKASGSSDVTVKKVSGEIDVNVSRAADVRVNGVDYKRG